MNEEMKGQYCTKAEGIALNFDTEMTALLETTNKLEEIDQLRKQYEVKAKQNVAEATKEDGKPKYTNETMREAAITQELDLNLAYQEVNAAYKELRKKKNEIESVIEVLKFKLRSLEIISRIIDA